MPTVTMRVLLWVGLVCVSALPAAGQQPAAQQRPLRLEDGFLAEDIGEAKFSPDGKALAVVRLRPIGEVRGYLQPMKGVRGDIWVQTAPGEPLKAITRGRSDGSGNWQPQWSPDGRQLAFLRAQGAAAVTPWLWDRERGTLKQLSTRSVDITDGQPCRWAGSRRLLCLVAKAGEVIPPTGYQQSRIRVERAWQQQADGGLTASMLDSRFYELPRRDLLAIDPSSGGSQVIAETLRCDTLLGFASIALSCWWLAPDGSNVAFLKAQPIRNVADGRRVLADNIWRRSFTLELRSTDGQRLSLSQPMPDDVAASSLSWSPDGRQLAFYTRSFAGEGPFTTLMMTARLWRISLPEGRLDEMDTGTLRTGWLEPQSWGDDDQGHPSFAPLLWSDGERPQLLVRVLEKEWAVGRNHPPRAPAQPYRSAAKSGSSARPDKPADAQLADAKLLDYAPATSSALYLQNDWNGTSLWRLESSKDKPQRLLGANGFFGQIARPHIEWFDYSSSEGMKRRGLVLLPYGYVAGRRYPTVVSARMGSTSGIMRGTGRLVLAPPTGNDAYDLRNLASMGYLVFAPDLDEFIRYAASEREGALIRLGNEIHAALDAVVEQGYADPDRFLIEGGSGTGKTALFVIATTHRFKAAVAYASGGPNDLTSASWASYVRYTDYAHAYVNRQGRNFPGMRYSQEEMRAGSIMSHVKLVQTPVLLAHGDLDVIPLEGSEEYFNALVFHGKRAQFVRYWGEGHGLGEHNMANLADFFQREFAWFDDFADIARDAGGRMVWDGGRVKSRNGAAPLNPEDYRKFEFFHSGGGLSK